MIVLGKKNKYRIVYHQRAAAVSFQFTDIRSLASITSVSTSDTSAAVSWVGLFRYIG